MADDALKLKISKKAYVFELKKKFEAKKTFSIKKAAAPTPADAIKEKIESIFKKNAPKDEKPSPPSAPKSTILQAIAVAFVVFFGLVLFVLISVFSTPVSQPLPQPKPHFSGTLSFKIDDWLMLTSQSGEENAYSAYMLVSYSASNLSSLNFSVSLYPQQPPTHVFLLDYPKDSASSYSSFKKALTANLKKHSIAVSEIGIEKLPSLGQESILIIPTGYFPAELLGIGNSFTYKDLLAKGVTLIYIGMPFDNQALNQDGLPVSVSHRSLSFDRKARPRSTEGFRLFNAQYAVSSSQEDKELVVRPQIYGSVSHLTYKSGSLLLLPQSLDGGWRERDVAGSWMEKGEVAAEDIAMLILQQPWTASLDKKVFTASLNSTKISIFSNSVGLDRVYVKLVATATDLNGITQNFLEIVKLEKKQKGTLSPSEPKIIPFYLSGQKARLNLALRENSTSPVKLYVEMYKDGQLLQRTDVEPGLTIPTTEKSIDLQVNSEPGNYVVLITDDSGKIYAGCELEVADLDISLNYSNWEKGKFSFLLSSFGQPIEPRAISVSIDGKHETYYTPAMLAFTPTATVLEYSYPEKFESGTYNFIFTIGAYKKVITQEYVRVPQVWENPVVLLLGFLSLVITVIGTIMRKPEETRYGLDIPDFPPLSTIKIPVKRQTVMEIFESVNNSYSWQRMPLRLEEIKNGFRKLTYQGKPILIGDFNLERILSKMEQEGLVKQEAGYWGLTKWEKESNHSIHYLTVYRMLRNAFVNNAVKFSKLDAIEECDVKAIAANEELFIHIMEKPYDRQIHRALATAKKGTTLLVFKTNDEKEAFRALLNSTSKLAVALKMEIESGRIFLISAKDEISAFLKGLIR
ncbi:MAG: hypothetical protein N3G80_03775 [Candidatus Micrarchaeota archaeon]|nr:hypothetical protein [Candidatus Micrarchaeota archaeon]